MVQNGNFASTSNWNVNVGASTTFTTNNNEATIVAQAQFGGIYQSINTIVNHKYLVSFEYKSTQLMRTHFKNDFPATNIYTKITNVLNATTSSIYYQFYSNITDGENTINIKNAMYIDLTLLFGSTIANYIYGLETASPGSGVAYIRKLFPNAYYAYDAGSLQSVKISEHKFTGKNLFDKNTVLDGYRIGANGTPFAAEGMSLSDYIPANEFTTYTRNITMSGDDCVAFYDSSQNFIYRLASSTPFTSFETPSGTAYIRTAIASAYVDTCQLEYGESATSYEPYESHSYALDSSKEFRGLFKLDSANKLYCDGDIYESNGIVTRKYNSMTISSENVIEVSTAYSNIKYYKVAKPSDMYSYGKYEEQFLLNTLGFTQGIATGNWDDANYINAIITRADTNSLWFGFAVGTTLEQAKSKLGGAVLLYEVALPTVESATPFSNPQFYDKFGTEEYVDYGVSQNTRDVAIPSGHETSYVKYH